MRYRQKAFTLIELMVTMAIVVILISVAVPSYATFMANERVVTQTNELVGALNLTRSEAIRRGTPVSLVPVTSGFVSGWNICAGLVASASAGCPVGVTLIRTHEAMGAVALSTAPSVSIVFDGYGRKSSPTADQRYVVQPPSCGTSEARAKQITINSSGRAALSRVNCG